jgi:adenosine deaminase
VNPWQRLPKVELHLHLDCSLSFDAVRQLDPAVTPEIYAREFVAPDKCANLADYLARPPRSVALLQTEQALRLSVNDLMDQLARDGVIYAEIRFAPLLHTAAGLAAEQVVRIVEDETGQAARRTGIEAYLILCTLRHFSAAQSLATAELVAGFRGTRVVALDLAGDEAGYPVDPHLAAFRLALEYNLHRTAHAGEARGPESVWETLKKLRPSRLGHGVRSMEDPALVDHLRRERIHLEICPTSNVQIGVYPTYADHPIDRLYRQGVSVGVNTDARAVTKVTLSEEYERLAYAFGWREADFLTCNLNAIEAAFAPAEVKQRIAGRLQRRESH